MKYLNIPLWALLFMSAFVLYAQEDDLDNLFDAPQEDFIVEEPETDHRTQFEESEKIKISGSYYARGLVAAGWTDWNFFRDIGSGFDASAGLESSVKISMDARPAPELHIFGSLSASFDPYTSLQEAGEAASAEAVWSADIDEIYADYILKDTLFTRLGKFSAGWGQGRFYTPGNLMSGSSDSDFNFRLTLPSLAGLSFVLLTNDSTSYRDFTYGGKADFLFGQTMISPAVTYRESEGFKTLLSFKQVILKTDFLVDFVTSIGNDGSLDDLFVVAGFYREWKDIKLYGEYQYSRFETIALPEPVPDLNIVNFHSASLAFGWNNPFGAPFDLGLQWEQVFNDWSGSVTLALTQKIFPFVKMTIGLPIVYGADDSYAVVNNSDPSGRRIALGLALELSGSF